MRSTFNINIYCRESKRDKYGRAPLEMSILCNQKRFFVNLPMKADPSEFNRKKQPRELKDYCLRVLERVDGILLEMNRRNIPVTAERLRDYIKTGGFKAYKISNLFDEFITIQGKRVGIDLTDSAFQKFVLLRKLFLGEKGDMECEDLTPGIVQDFYYELNKRYATSTASGYISKLRTILKYGMDNGKFKTNPVQGLKVKRFVPDVDWLTPEEIRKLENTEIENQSLRDVRDAFLLQVYSGLSYVDLENLTQEDIKESNGTYYITKPRKKTGVVYTAVILPRGVEILKAHNWKMKVISNQKMNIYLKTIMVLCGIDHKLKTHLGRKTYGHLLLNSGVRLETVAKALGHSNSKTTSKFYAEVAAETVLKEISSNCNLH